MLKRITIITAATLLAASLSACEDQKKDSSSDRGQKLTEQAFGQQEKAVPYPVAELKDSLERRNLKERLLRQNDPDRVGYVYILSFGKFIGYYTIKGKVSSTQSQMTTANLTDYACDDGIQGCQAQVLEAPGDERFLRPERAGSVLLHHGRRHGAGVDGLHLRRPAHQRRQRARAQPVRLR